MKKLIKEQVKVIVKTQKIKPKDGDKIARICEVVEACEAGLHLSLWTAEYYAAGYLRGVAEAQDKTLTELLEDA